MAAGPQAMAVPPGNSMVTLFGPIAVDITTRHGAAGGRLTPPPQ
jgi:hypothetical protein